MKRYTLPIAILLAAMLALSACTFPGPSTTPTATPPTTTASPTTGSLQTTTTSVVSGAPTPTATQPVLSSVVAGLEGAIESVYQRVNPSVVNIEVALPPTLLNPGGGALASGFVWDTSGNIVTNNHVVAGATSITVSFSDGTIVDATLVGTDPDSDLAVIKVDPAATHLQPVELADSAAVKVGQMAIAIGNPFGLQGTLTVGYVSAVARTLPSNLNATGPTYSIPAIIQTDAAINPGNSGGTLLDSSGRVIGVTSSIESTSGTSAGVGFAIPSDIVQRVVPALIATGHYTHPYLGVTLTSLVPDLARAMNLASNQRGALVEAVTSGGPAAKAGLRAGTTQVTVNGQQLSVGGDVIIAFSGQAVQSSDDLIAILELSGSAGQTVTLTILRNGNQMQVPVTIGARPSAQP